ncbi:hypothetical protein TURU_083119 [Turdus rufiventris]|nr:hypothetical protein TURU_083119 [Turdus rufiventris]
MQMAFALWKNLLQTTKKRILQQRRLSLYNGAHGYEEELIKKKLQQFSGGSIDLSKEDNGIGILTLNNPKLMNAFTAIVMALTSTTDLCLNIIMLVVFGQSSSWEYMAKWTINHLKLA